MATTSWMGLLLITAQIRFSLEQFEGFTCEDVCNSLRSNLSSNLSFYITIAPNSTVNESSLNFCNDSGNIPAPIAVNDSSTLMAYPPCTDVYDEDYMGVELRLVNTSLNVSAPLINVSSCLRACAVCKVDRQCSFSREGGSACEGVTMEDITACTRMELGLFLSEDELLMKLRGINDSYNRYKSVIGRVVPGVLISDNDKPMCLVSVCTHIRTGRGLALPDHMKEAVWLHATTHDSGDRVRPGRSVCFV